MAQKKEDVYAALNLYRGLAYYIHRREEYERALHYYDEALTRAPADKRSLLGRANARAKVCQYKGAMNDIAKILNADPEDLLTIAQKALLDYYTCEFEDALVLNVRMVPIRKKPDDFVMGVMNCTETIQNGVGTRAGQPLREHFKIIRRFAWKKYRDAEKPAEHISKYRKKKKRKKNIKKEEVHEPVVPKIRIRTTKEVQDENTQTGDEPQRLDTISIVDSLNTLKTESDIIPRCKPFPFRPMQRYTSNIQNYMSEKYLDSMYLDKIFLRDVKKNAGVGSPNKEGVKKVLQMSKEGFKMLGYKQELLRTRRPFYNIKYQEARISAAMQMRITQELRKMQSAAVKDANKLLLNVEAALQMKQTRVALECAEKLVVFCELKPKKVLPSKEVYLEDLYDYIAYAYFIMFRINPRHLEFQTRRRILNWYGVPLSRQPSSDSVINQFKDVFIDWKKEIIVYEERLRKASTPEEMAWLYYELARHHTETKQYELARVYARKCMAESENRHWLINAMMIIARLNFLQNNKNDTKTQLQEVLLINQKFKFLGLDEFVLKCLEMLDTIESDDFIGVKVLEKRERQIIKMMDSIGMKDEVAFLFRKMGAMPTTRRMSVMPGVRLDSDQTITPSKRKMSIRPVTKVSEEPSTSPKTKGSRSGAGKGLEKIGIRFMDLIKFHVD